MGADFAWDSSSNGYVISNIVRGDIWHRRHSGPLARLGVSVRPGDVLTAINSQQLTPAFSPAIALADCADSEVTLTDECLYVCKLAVCSLFSLILFAASIYTARYC